MTATNACLLVAVTLATICTPSTDAFQPSAAISAAVGKPHATATTTSIRNTAADAQDNGVSRRSFFVGVAGTSAAALAGWTSNPAPAEAIGPVKINLLNPSYSARPCPKNKPIPGEKAMKGMRGLCVTVDVDMETATEKDLDKVGVYGFITDAQTGESVLANNPDLSTDAGQFAMVEKVTPKDNKLQFEFIAAVPRELDYTQFDTGICPLKFESLRIISFPGGQQYGAINPCEMNEFSDECSAWEDENGPYEKIEYMMKSNPRTKGR